MRRMLLHVLAVVLFVTAPGCLAVSASKTTRFGTDSDLLAVDGRAYIVDKKSRRVWEVDLTSAKPWTAEGDADTDPDKD